MVSCGITSRFQLLSPSTVQVLHALLTRPPLCNEIRPKTSFITPFDLHVLGTPPAFILSQDRTLMLKIELLRISISSSCFAETASFHF